MDNNTKPIKHKFTLINKSRVKKATLELAKATRAHTFTRVSEEFLIDVEVQVRNIITQKIKVHPSKGKTLM